MNDIMYRIQSRRLELNLSYQDLATRTNMSKSTLQRYETGSIKNMPIDKLDIIATALQVSPLWLLGIAANNTSLSKEETSLLKNFNQLNDLGKKEANKRVSELTEISKYKNETAKPHLDVLAAHDDNLDEDTKKQSLDIAMREFEAMDKE